MNYYQIFFFVLMSTCLIFCVFILLMGLKKGGRVPGARYIPPPPKRKPKTKKTKK